MAKLYIFGIGGTGSRVIKSLTMLLASGVKLKKYDTIVPIIIDPDIANGDMERTLDILKLYQEIRNKITNPKDFFNNSIKTLSNLVDDDDVIEANNFKFDIDGTQGGRKFEEYIGLATFNKDENRDFVKLLFSEWNLGLDLDVGFRGNPNMGSVVLNQFSNSTNFEDFGNSFNQGDGIFIISSIFGGTGSAGFPLLLKLLRSGAANLPNANLISQAPIGAISVLPYFNLDINEDSNIKSNTFIEKSKIAIDYYNRTIIQTNQIDNIYFIGNDNILNTYANFEGKKEQKNKAHFIELASALSIIDFTKTGNRNGAVVVKEFGINNNDKVLDFNSLSTIDQNDIKNNLTKFNLFSLYLSKGLEKSLGVSAWTKKKTLLNYNFFNSDEYKNKVEKFNAYYKEFIGELETNNPGFKPFDNDVSHDLALTFQSKKPKKSVFIIGEGLKHIDIENCIFIEKADKRNGISQLISLFELSIEKVLSKKEII